MKIPTEGPFRYAGTHIVIMILADGVPYQSEQFYVCMLIVCMYVCGDFNI